MQRRAPAAFLGYQKVDHPEAPQPIELWILTEDIPGYPEGSTVSRRTLEKAGYFVPTPPEKPPAPAYAPAGSHETDNR